MGTKKIGSKNLHSANLTFFVEHIFKNDFIDASTINEVSIKLYDLMLTQGFFFTEGEDIIDSQNLFRAAKDLLQDKIKDQISEKSKE